MSQMIKKDNDFIPKKRISVSRKRQITIPIEFFNSVGIEKEVECFVQNNSIIIRPVQECSGEFDEQILADLISQGLSGEELLVKFKETRRKIRPAVLSLLSDAELAAEGKTSYSTYKEIFDSEAE
jgi:bifunctional DNA-binding transcriptional regulator/antitoxin component of YhaV-PrlF toxin-antitoxin module